MSSYHSSFSYNNENTSKNHGLVIVAFEPDEGFMDSFLSMDNVSDDYYDGTKRFDYGSKYNTSAEIQITLIKKDGTDMKLNEFRSYAKWLTGARVNSWLDMYVGDKIVYSFLGKFLNLEHYKFDGRVIGLRATFSSVSPWAYSAEQHFDYTIGQTLDIDDNGVLFVKTNVEDYLDRNVLRLPEVDAHSDNGVTFAYTDGTIIVNGTAGSMARATVVESVSQEIMLNLPPNKYVLLREPCNVRLNIKTIDGVHVNVTHVDEKESYITFEVKDVTTEVFMYASVVDGNSCDNISVRPVIVEQSKFDNVLAIDEDGCLHCYVGVEKDFSIYEDGVAYIDTATPIETNNQTDDLYTYINLDVHYENKKGKYVSIKNITLDEETTINGLSENENVLLSAKQFITSDKPHKIFGDSFNFVWPRLAPGVNEFVVDADGEGQIEFSYRYPMKVGDCTMDVSVYGEGIYCGDCDEIPSYDTVRWQDIIGTPTSISGYGITDAYTTNEVDNKIENIDVEWTDIDNTPDTLEGYGVTDVYTKSEIDEKLENIDVSGGGSGGGSVNVDEEELNNMLKDILGT